MKKNYLSKWAKSLSLVLLSSFALLITSCGQKGQFGDFNTELIPVNIEDGKWGYINTEGEEVIFPHYDYASMFSNGRALVGFHLKVGKGQLGYIDEEGKTVIAPKYKMALQFTEGLAWTLKEGGYPVAINTAGEEVFTLKNAYSVSPFIGDYAIFSVHDDSGILRKGMVDKKGAVVIPAKYQDLEPFVNGLAKAQNDEDLWGCIDKDDKICLDFKYTDLSFVGCPEDRIIVSVKEDPSEELSEDKFGVIDYKGNFIVKAKYDKLYGDENGFVLSDDKFYGYVDKDGNELIVPQFEQLKGFGEVDACAFAQEGKWGLVNKEGIVVKAPEYKDCMSWSEGLCAVELEDGFDGSSWGYINDEFELVIKAKYDKAYPFYNGFAWVKVDGAYGLINKDGDYVIKPKYDYVDELYRYFSYYSKLSNYLNEKLSSDVLYSDAYCMEAIRKRIHFDGVADYKIGDDVKSLIKLDEDKGFHLVEGSPWLLGNLDYCDAPFRIYQTKSFGNYELQESFDVDLSNYHISSVSYQIETSDEEGLNHLQESIKQDLDKEFSLDEDNRYGNDKFGVVFERESEGRLVLTIFQKVEEPNFYKDIEGAIDIEEPPVFEEVPDEPIIEEDAIKVEDEPLPELPVEKNNDEHKVFTVVEEPCQFPGGMGALMKFLSKNINYPEIAQDNGIQGRVIVSFIVEKDGLPSNVKVVRGIDPALDKEAVRVVKKMPAWKPGKQQGKSVRQRFTLPVVFRLQ